MYVHPTEMPAPATLSAPDAFHIAFCVDDFYFRSMGATMASIVESNPDTRFTFHVFAFTVSEDQRRRLREFENKFKAEVQTHVVDQNTFRQFGSFIEFSYYSLAIFTRLIIPSVLRGQTNKVLYLDADILCVGSVRELAQLDIKNDIAVVVPDAEVTTRRRCEALQLRHPRYFNSGFLYMNIEKWIEHRITEDAMQALLQYGKKLRFSDQDALNIALDGRARFIDRKWNFLYDTVHDLDRNRLRMRAVGNAVFIHFAGAIKPWHDWSGHDSRHLFVKYHAISPWSDMPLDQAPRHSREMRLISRFAMRRGEVLLGLRWYLKYLRARAKK